MLFLFSEKKIINKGLIIKKNKEDAFSMHPPVLRIMKK